LIREGAANRTVRGEDRWRTAAPSMLSPSLSLSLSLSLDFRLGQLQVSCVESQFPLQQSPLPPLGIPVFKQQRFPAVVTELFEQTAPVPA
jgi:hypothetical protein